MFNKTYKFKLEGNTENPKKQAFGVVRARNAVKAWTEIKKWMEKKCTEYKDYWITNITRV